MDERTPLSPPGPASPPPSRRRQRGLTDPPIPMQSSGRGRPDHNVRLWYWLTPGGVEQLGVVVVPSGAGLVASSPSRPGIAEVAGGAAHRVAARRRRRGPRGRRPSPGRGRRRAAGRRRWRAACRCRARPRAARCRWRRDAAWRAGPGGRRRWPAAPGRTSTRRRGGRRRARSGPGAGPVRFAPCLAGGILQSATADAGEVRIVSSVTPGSGAILSVGALLQAATVVRRLRSAAAGERDAAERQAGSRSRDLGGAAAAAAGCGGGATGDAGSESGGPRGGRRS
jgi:hypothetical protein